MLTAIDYIVIAVYLVGVALFGIYAGGKQSSTTDYFLGGRDMPWWAVCFSVVATETSTLTVISVPAVAYGGAMTFLQLTIGYMLGRIVVALYFLPRYYEGNLSTAYAFLGNRFGRGMQATASVTFLFTRLLADGVRLFATAIPLFLIAESVGLSTNYFQIIAVIGVVTIIYTLIGGIKAVVWMDVVQMLLYIAGGAVAIAVLLGELPAGWWQRAAEAGKTQIIDVQLGEGFAAWFTSPYAFVTAVLGGAVFSMASHGTDQLIVQRLLACRNLRDSQKAIIGSAVVVAFQFALFLFVGMMLWVYHDGATPQAMGLTRADEVFSQYIISGLPPGLSGLILAGIVAAAMSTLSSSLNSLASSTMYDLYERFAGKQPGDERALRLSRIMTLVWGLIFIAFANLFESQNNPVVELGLAIASFTYGGLLGAFLLGLLSEHARQLDAVVAFVVTIVVIAFVIFGVWHGEGGWVFEPVAGTRRVLNLAGAQGGSELTQIGYPWYAVIGGLLTVALGSLLGLRHRYGSG